MDICPGFDNSGKSFGSNRNINENIKGCWCLAGFKINEKTDKDGRAKELVKKIVKRLRQKGKLRKSMSSNEHYYD